MMNKYKIIICWIEDSEPIPALQIRRLTLVKSYHR